MIDSMSLSNSNTRAQQSLINMIDESQPSTKSLVLQSLLQ
jgi:hypothetical protein